ncbi:16S rRNA (uracil(1498)-N(3))-methyltransferase [Planosporangium flavigriseum]|uniref:Ribosomal RNA small subunit methyltransferase E n=1 Tax=Planosporangium flavigriseum TaxID=373681 RepID=A0A8J3PNU2_9ACTN|nr:16S rRNA (uracil(1498)-N(3))-methyltransferase [Planosporangium flavigriseum]NJC67174.1 16S rRNA (uracil(1498)-N(3))-methyltransferase [Planosporangium flavigriseum]GIG75709.1 ribosomal RNA small subunit methyltransferase E [Planosporangium flavigriseum]
MSLPLFLVDALPEGDEFRLDGPEGHHAATVQRLRVGEGLLLGDGRGGTATAVVTAVGRGTLDVTITDRGYVPPPAPRLVVVQGIAKGDRGELAVQAMTEVGVDEIIPWVAARSVAKWKDDRPLNRWRSTVREAAKQARRPRMPEVTEPVTTSVLARRPGPLLVLHEEASVPLSRVDLPDAGEITLVVGPEGGIAPDELTTLSAAGAQSVRLGPEVLRTSTAGVAALAALSVRLGRW